jgi:hypothetical protein
LTDVFDPGEMDDPVNCLPDELLLMIFRNLFVEIRDLFQSARVCKRWFTLTHDANLRNEWKKTFVILVVRKTSAIDIIRVIVRRSLKLPEFKETMCCRMNLNPADVQIWLRQRLPHHNYPIWKYHLLNAKETIDMGSVSFQPRDLIVLHEKDEVGNFSDLPQLRYY